MTKPEDKIIEQIASLLSTINWQTCVSKTHCILLIVQNCPKSISSNFLRSAIFTRLYKSVYWGYVAILHGLCVLPATEENGANTGIITGKLGNKKSALGTFKPNDLSLKE